MGVCDTSAFVGMPIGLMIVPVRPICTLPAVPPCPNVPPSAFMTPRRSFAASGMALVIEA